MRLVTSSTGGRFLTEILDLSPLAGSHGARIRFVFDWTAQWYFHGDWAIDDVRIFRLDPAHPDLQAGGPDAAEFRIDQDSCSNTTMPACDAHELAVTYAPVTIGAHEASLAVPSNDPDTPTLSVALSGTSGFEVAPLRGTVRTHIALTARGFGVKKGTITIGSTPCKVDSWSDHGASCLLTKVLSPALYSASVQTGGKKGPVFAMPSVFEASAPTIDAIVPDHASPGAQIILHGSFLSTKSDTSKVTVTGPLGGTVRTRPCKISSWTIDNGTGASSVLAPSPPSSERVSTTSRSRTAVSRPGGRAR